MRTFKFRAWLKELKHMVDVYEIVFAEKGCSIRIKGYDHRHYRTFKHGEFVLQQFTGLRDKDGQDIYEGDVIERLCEYPDRPVDDILRRYDGAIGKVEYHANYGNAGFCVELISGHDWSFHDPEGSSWDSQYVKVIGNVYEHPHLLPRKGEEG